MGLINQFHRLRIAQSTPFSVLDYLNASYNLSHWFASDEFNGATSDGDNITSWTDKVTTSNASKIGTNAIKLRILGGRNYASFNESAKNNGAFEMTEATFSSMGFDDTSQMIFLKTANITNTSELSLYSKGKEDPFATAEHSLKIDSNSYTIRHQGASDSSRSHPLDDGDWIIVRTDGTNTKLYTYDISSSTLTQRSNYTNGTASDTDRLVIGGDIDEGGGMVNGAKIYVSDLLFFSDTMTTTEIEDVCDYIDDNT